MPSRAGKKSLSLEVRQQVMRLAAKGCTYRQIAGQVSVSQGSVGNVLRPLGGVIRSDMLNPTGKRLTGASDFSRVGGWRGGPSWGL